MTFQSQGGVTVVTFEERVAALAPLGFTPRQTRFLATVALHSGFCLRRQYAEFAGLKYGRWVRSFLDEVVERDLARRISYKADRGFLYHLHGRALYRAIEQDDNRNRKLSGPALVARKVMVLDAVIAHRDVEWFATEQDKVSLFTRRFSVPLDHLPNRRYTATDAGQPSTIRYFIHKLPIYLADEPPVPHFICLSTAVGGGECKQFLEDHARLLESLPEWVLVIAGPGASLDQVSCQRLFDRFVAGELATPARYDVTLLSWYFATRRAVEQKDLNRLSVDDLNRFREMHAKRGSSLDSLYEGWWTQGDRVIASIDSSTALARRTHGRLEFHLLPHRYTQFGDLPGVC